MFQIGSTTKQETEKGYKKEKLEFRILINHIKHQLP